ncbi:hypothetical protein R3I93_019121 [Phoxinus phoxinus]|uniref:Uncharacterized protein n=1 Tax=Phoxinus phoxinus TaxID=58324 RepID=A0AAN9CEJ7_9TELE
MLHIQVALLLLLAICCTSSRTTVKTVQQGATVNEPIISVSTLDKHDQLMAYHGGELSAQYFCDNGTCHNHPESVCQFKIYSGDLCLIIPNVNVSNSGEYKVVLNELKDVRTLILRVEEVPQHSLLIWLVPVIAASVIAAGLFLVIRLKYKKPGFQRTATTSI